LTHGVSVHAHVHYHVHVVTLLLQLLENEFQVVQLVILIALFTKS
jgi:hypothetical protein